MRGAQLEMVLLGLAGLVLASTLVKVLRLAAPVPQRAVPASIALAGYRVERAGAGATGHRDRNISYGSLTLWRLSPADGSPTMTLSLLPVRSRNYGGLDMAAMERLAGSLVLRERRLIDADTSTTFPAGRQELALGRGPADDAGATTRLQSCLTRGGQAGVTANTLTRQLVDERMSEIKSNRLRSRLLQFSGLKPNSRSECLAVQLETQADDNSEMRLLAAWAALQPALRR